MAYENLEKLMGLMSGTEDPDHPDNAVLVAELGDPASVASRLRDHIHGQTELVLADPPDDLKFDVQHGLAEAMTFTRRRMGAAMPESDMPTHRATVHDVAAVVEALRMPPDALRTKAARSAAVKAGIANIRAQNPDSTLEHPEQFDAAVDGWLKAHVRHIDLLLRGK